MGKPLAPNHPFESVTTIHESLINKDCLAYLRQKILAKMGLVPEKQGHGVGDKFITDMFAWNKSVML
jgi:hypothetical protein